MKEGWWANVQGTVVLAIVGVQWKWAISTEMSPRFDLPGVVNLR